MSNLFEFIMASVLGLTVLVLVIIYGVIPELNNWEGNEVQCTFAVYGDISGFVVYDNGDMIVIDGSYYDWDIATNTTDIRDGEFVFSKDDCYRLSPDIARYKDKIRFHNNLLLVNEE